MSRVLFLNLDEGVVTIRCLSEDVGISALERLPSGGVRLVCMSSAGAEIIRNKLKAYLIGGDIIRERHRPVTPLW